MMKAGTAQLLRKLQKAGWQIKHGTRHYRCRSPSGKQVIIISSSPSVSGLWHEQLKVRKALSEGK